jgi:hypothetical protein
MNAISPGGDGGSNSGILGAGAEMLAFKMIAEIGNLQKNASEELKKCLPKKVGEWSYIRDLFPKEEELVRVPTEPNLVDAECLSLE